jgi:hypothetical protein
MTAAEGDFGGDVAAVNLSCAGSLVLSAGPDPQPAQDRIRILRVDRDQWTPYTQVELSGAVRRLVAMPPSPDAQGRSVIVLAVAEDQGHAYRLDAMEMSCPQ